MKIAQINKWHKSLNKDCYRNDIIIPFLLQYIHSQKKYITILDIGSGSGYIHQHVLPKSKSKIIRYYALDKDINMINFSKKNNIINHSAKISFLHANILDVNFFKKVDLIILSFSLLEFKPNQKFCKKLSKYLKKNASILIFIPDILQDILEKHEFSSLKKYIDNKLFFKKRNKFTKVVFPFVVNRTEKLLECFTANNLQIKSIVEKECLNKKSYIIEVVNG